ncbi:MAG: MlaD family protein [Planctomycetota bacterium]|nr:MlaD family protein [Planctomycetota bacterium]
MNREVSPTLRWITRIGVTSCVVLMALVIPGFFASWERSDSMTSLSVQLPHAGSVRVGSAICFRGFPVGKVTAIDLVIAGGTNIAQAQDAEGAKLILTGSIESRISKLITEDSIVSVRDLPFPSIDIVPGSGAPLGKDSTLVSRHGKLGDPAQEYLRALQALRHTAESIGQVTDLIKGQGGLQETLRTMGDAGHSVRETAEELRILIRDGRSPILSSLQQAEEILLELRAHARSLPEAAESIVRVGRKGETVLRNIDQMLHENRAPLRATVENFQSTSEDLHGLASDLRRRPWRILKSPGDRESAFIALHESANRYAEGALEVRRATEQVRDLLNRRGEDRDVLEFLGDALRTLGERLDQQAELEQGLLQRTRDLAPR